MLKIQKYQAFLCVLRENRFFPLKLDLFPIKLDFSTILHFIMNFREKCESSYTIFMNKSFGKRQTSTVLSINLENPSRNLESSQK